MAASKVEYNQILVEAAYSVLLELAHLLREYQEGIVVVGGLVPGLLFDNPSEKHVGSIDVDLALDQHTIQTQVIARLWNCLFQGVTWKEISRLFSTGM